MSGQVSPDGHYYWDGGQWKTAISPDGGWRWDGSAWRPVSAPKGRASRLPWIVAAVVVASIVVGSVGLYLAYGYVSARVPHLLSGAGVTVTCGSPQAQPGAAVMQGDVVCGGHVGASTFGVDCTELSGIPPSVNVYDEVKGADWQLVEITADSAGCGLVVAPKHIRTFDTAKVQGASSLAIADFVPERSLGGIGLQVACTKAASCVDFSTYQDGAFSLDEGKPNDGYDNMTAGFAGLFGSLIKIGKANRLIVRVQGRDVMVFLNGTFVTRATTKRDVTSGYVTFGADNREGSATETVMLQRLLVFEAV
jgi:hypothetical protein